MTLRDTQTYHVTPTKGSRQKKKWSNFGLCPNRGGGVRTGTPKVQTHILKKGQNNESFSKKIYPPNFKPCRSKQ